MTLREYLFYKNLKKSEFAPQINIASTYLCSILTGKQKMSLKVAKAVEKATNGELQVDDLLADYGQIS